MRVGYGGLLGISLCVTFLNAAQADSPAAAPGKQDVPNPAAQKVVLVIHGGAGVLSDAEMNAEGVRREDYEVALAQSLRAGHKMLRLPGKSGVDAVETAIRVLEDCALFNAGRGAALTQDGRAELDASIMQGTMTGTADGKLDPRKRAGAVTCVTHVKNPISAARAVMEMEGSRHVMLAGEGAERVVLTAANRARYDLQSVSNVYFWTDRRLKQIREGIARPPSAGKTATFGTPRLETAAIDGPAIGADRRLGTVGAVALDASGHLTAGTSTGGVTSKLTGRIGDSPVIGAGTYADDRACGVSCTGTGEVFIRHAVAHDVIARMLYKKVGVAQAARETIDQLPDEDGGIGGLIALDRDGRHAFVMSARSDGMYRGYITESGDVYIAVRAAEKEKLIK